MLDVQPFTDADGHRVEIDRREVVSAYVERAKGRSTIQITCGEGEACSLGIGAREEIEAWLDRELEVLSAVAAYVKPVAATAKDLAWPDLRLADLRDEAIVRVGPAAAAREIAALAMIVLHHGGWAHDEKHRDRDAGRADHAHHDRHRPIPSARQQASQTDRVG